MKRFTLDPDKAVLVIIDMQEFSCVTEDESRRLALDRVVIQPACCRLSEIEYPRYLGSA